MLQRCLRRDLGALPKSDSRLNNLVFPATTLELEQVFLEVPTFAMGECRGDDFSYLFKYGGRSPLETRYCYYNDPKKTVRTLRSEGVRGIGRQITKRDYLTPIFLLDLVNPITNPSMALCSQRFILRTFKGFSHRSGEKVFPLQRHPLLPRANVQEHSHQRARSATNPARPDLIWGLHEHTCTKSSGYVDNASTRPAT